MCKFPKIVPVRLVDEKGEKIFHFVAPCGKCYDCKRELSNQFVLRCNSEFLHCACAFFCTLTYDNKNIRYMLPDRVRRRRALDYIESLPCSVFGMYDEFILSKDDAVMFRKKLQESIKRYGENLLFRFVLNGEYGTFTHRPHMHALIFSPLYFNLGDFVRLIESCWRLGNVTVSAVTPSRINYCAKHTMKQDTGSELQQEISPIFQKRSTFQGGIGRDLVNDRSILSNYHRDMNFFQTGKYKISIPRYIRKKLSPEKKTREELLQLEQDSFDNLVYRISQDVMFCQASDFNQNFDSTLTDRMFDAVQLFKSVNYDSVVAELRDFYNRKFWEHVNRVRHKEMLVC